MSSQVLGFYLVLYGFVFCYIGTLGAIEGRVAVMDSEWNPARLMCLAIFALLMACGVCFNLDLV